MARGQGKSVRMYSTWDRVQPSEVELNAKHVDVAGDGIETRAGVISLQEVH